MDVDNPLGGTPRNPALLARGEPASSDDSNFFRSAKWCPDGSRALGQCEDGTLQILKFDGESRISVESVFPQPSPILDAIWYPWANLEDPASYCFVASVRECPVKLLNAADGRLRASYKIVDHRERQIGPHCLAFNPMASHLYCGYEEAIQVFDFQRPGEGTILKTTPTKKSKDGMKGIVSSISFCQDYSGLFAAGSLSSAVTLFHENSGENPVAYLDGMTSAISQVKFDPVSTYKLYASERHSDRILCWDVRNPFQVLRHFERSASRTNQKISFDIDATGTWLVTGDQAGDITFFHLTDDELSKFHAHDDAIGSVSINHQSNQLLSVSGSRIFDNSPTNSESESESEESSGSEGHSSVLHKPLRRPLAPRTVESSAKLWDLTEFLEGRDNVENPQRGTALKNQEKESISPIT